MTPKQEEKIRNKIKKIKAALAADKKFWGGEYHDGQGLRYLQPELYIKLNDFTGGLRYFNWFNKHFPDDGCYPEFLLEWTIILFKTKRLKEAEKKAFETFCNNTYLFDVFFGNEVKKIKKREWTNLETLEYAEKYLSYSKDQDYLNDFAEWLNKLISNEKFSNICIKYIDIQKRLEDENDEEIRGYLYQQKKQLIDEL